MFLADQTFSILAPLVGPWDPIMHPCDKSVILAGSYKIQIKIVYGFLSIRKFPCSLLWLRLWVPSWIVAAKM
jgi:hypothetical protein